MTVVGRRAGPDRGFLSRPRLPVRNVFEAFYPPSFALIPSFSSHFHFATPTDHASPFSCSLRLAHQSLWRIFNSFYNLLSIPFSRIYRASLRSCLVQIAPASDQPKGHSFFLNRQSRLWLRQIITFSRFSKNLKIIPK